MDTEAKITATNTRTEVQRTYRIQDAAPVKSTFHRELTIVPDSITLTYAGSGNVSWTVTGWRVLKDGRVSDNSRHDLSAYSLHETPEWVPELIEAVKRAQAAIAPSPDSLSVA